MRPVIGITGRPKYIESVGQPMRAYTVYHTYSDGILAHGGLPLVLIPSDMSTIPDILDTVDGLMFTGGGDIDPERYGADAHPTLAGVDEERDSFEIALAKAAYQHRIPTLAICRGLQILNVAFGGTLIQDLPSQRGATGHDQIGDAAWEKHDTVVVEAGTRLAGLIGAGAHGVNSIHHQAADHFGEGLRPVALHADGTVEALEHEDASWPMTAVQWHPEFLRVRDDETSDALFRTLIERAAKFRADR